MASPEYNNNGLDYKISQFLKARDILFLDGLNKNNKAFDYNALRNLINQMISDGNRYRVGDISYNGNSQGYIDIYILNSDPIPFKYSSMLISNRLMLTNRSYTYENSSYIVNIDNIEVNNFVDLSENLNDDFKKSIRIYFTISWWDTLLLWKFPFNIDGALERGHVCDWCNWIDKSNTHKVPIYSYMTFDTEYPISNPINESKRITNENSSPRISYLYILTTKAPITSDGNTQSLAEISIGYKNIGLGLSLCCVPLYDGRFYKYDRGGVIENSGVAGYGIDNITDSSVVGMWIGDFSSFYTANGMNIIADTTNHNAYIDIEVKFYGTNAGSNIRCVCAMKSISPISLYISDFSDGSNLMYKQPYYRHYIGNAGETIYWEYFLERDIPKLHVFPYYKCYIEKASDIVSVPTQFCLYSEIGNINYNGYGTAYFIYADSYVLSEESKYFQLADFGSFQPTSTNDYFTRINALMTGRQANSDLFTSISQVVGSIMSFNVGGALANIGGVANSTFNKTKVDASMEKLLRDGENGTIVNSGAVANMLVGNIKISHTRLNKINFYEIAEDLAIHGVTTNIRLKDVLDGALCTDGSVRPIHKRRRYNYVKTVYCDFEIGTALNVANTTLNNFIVTQITDMFNNGVFLHSLNTDDVNNWFKLKVPNYLEKLYDEEIVDPLLKY